MILTLIICFVFSLFLCIFVLSPLLSNRSKDILNTSFEGFNNSEELLKIIQLRDALFQKLIYGKSLNKTINEYSNEDALKGVVAICSRLQKASLSWQPKSLEEPIEKRNISEKGSTSFSCLICCFFILFSFFLFSSTFAFESENSSHFNQDKVTAPSDVVIPPPTILPGSSHWIPSVNQFILMPLQGKLYVYYVGMFSNIHQEKEAKIQIPLPKNFQELKINGNENIVFEKSEHSSPILKFPLTMGLNQLSAEFSLSAFNGSVEWLANDLKILPGFSIFIMPEYVGTIRNLFSIVSDNFNVWPPRILQIPEDYKSFVGADPFGNKADVKSQDTQQARQLIRVGNDQSPYPSFEIKGIVPQRTPIYVLALFFACFLFGLTSFFIIKTSK
ncbi:hypothetical protein [Fluviispira multicolorata]|uniref:Uncharacterized protein n=1 Tax=Fluviispira multicolorata TaxID=2654512 RepID=A0A833JE79_9BACT|nr:hypothetical protein [Fluviispira multicolorata]KAB8031922.1 hypothetical protein GCL57_04560 [Fluviispira multicolorata]